MMAALTIPAALSIALHVCSLLNGRIVVASV
jgi:hypothetical protein